MPFNISQGAAIQVNVSHDNKILSAARLIAPDGPAVDSHWDEASQKELPGRNTKWLSEPIALDKMEDHLVTSQHFSNCHFVVAIAITETGKQYYLMHIDPQQMSNVNVFGGPRWVSKAYEVLLPNYEDKAWGVPANCQKVSLVVVQKANPRYRFTQDLFRQNSGCKNIEMLMQGGSHADPFEIVFDFKQFTLIVKDEASKAVELHYQFKSTPQSISVQDIFAANREAEQLKKFSLFYAADVKRTANLLIAPVASDEAYAETYGKDNAMF